MLCIFLLLIASAVQCVDYVVDGRSGSDDNSGLGENQAYRTIGRCVQELSDPGDQCLVRGGRYHEVVGIQGIRGTAENPAVIREYREEWPVWDGGVAIQPDTWEKD